MWLVTGATGHIGNVLVRELLRRGEKVRALILPRESRAPLEGLDVEAVEGDVLNLDSLWQPLQGIRGVFHLAGVISILPGENPIVRKVNVEGTRNLLEAARRACVKRLVFTSSIHALRRVPDGVIDESVPYDVENPYGAYDRSKAEATLEVQHASECGLDTVITCPTGVIGPYDFRGSMMGAVIRTAAERKPTLYVDEAYDFVDVRDVADGLIAAARDGKRGESYILSGHR
ncbi:MAG TPA: NAD-dependent epimerase/dehydratase family protein, partial [Anaerolineales bacterium]